jgi:prepilin signal peptidase PulO-like enzyme (type II secretory pathway)
VAGSFINLAADRLPRGESLLWPRSHCRACDRRLNAVDLLPVLGYLIRAGRCATCHTPIGRSAPFVEATAGACMLAPIVVLGVWPGVALGAGLLAVWGLLVTTRAGRLFASGEAS